MLGNRVWATFSFSCTTSWVNCANKHSEAVLKWASQDVYDFIASQLGGCGDSRCHGTFDPINSQNVPCSHAALVQLVVHCTNVYILRITAGSTVSCTTSFKVYSHFNF